MFLAMQADEYYVAGLVIALSLVLEGPSPHFLADELYYALVTDPVKVVVTLENVPESDKKMDLCKVSTLSSL